MLPNTFPDRNVCVLGLGYVGMTLAVAMADAGFQVHGVEIREDILDKLRSGRPHFHEPGLAERLHHVLQRGRFTFGRTPECEHRHSVYIITVGTPLDAGGRVRTDMIEAATRQVADCLQDGDMVILRSTVKLGVTRNVVRPILADSGKRFDIAFCPERTLEGQALIELNQLPQIIGAESMDVAARASQIFGFLTPTTVKVSTLETAELIKLVDNTYRDVTFAFSNEIARLCNAMEVSAVEVVRAGKLGYPRTNLPLPGPVGGPCLEKDPHILIEGAREAGVEMEITAAGRHVNETQPLEVADFLETLARSMQGFPAEPTISLMGLAFKGRPETDDLRGTMAKPVLQELRARFPRAQWRGFDAVVAPGEIRAFGLEPADSMVGAVHGANLAVILNNHPVFTSMPLTDLASRMDRPGVIYDFWNNFNSRDINLPEGTAYIALGSHGAARFAHAG